MIGQGNNELSKQDIVDILVDTNPDHLRDLFHKAKKERDRVFGNKIFLYGFVYFSTWCRNDCNFCYYRKSNPILRYRKNSEEVFSIAKELAQSGVSLIDLTMGEDMAYHDEDFQSLLELTKRIKQELNMPVMISPGVINHKIIDQFAELHTDWYALYQETHNRELFEKLRVGQSYDERMEAKLYAKEKGIFIEEGLLAGVGESPEDLADSLFTMGEIGARQIRVMSFVPQKGSPMEQRATPDRQRELKLISLMRILYPAAIIPASLDVDGIKGLKDRLNAGANLVTSIIPPRSGLMGVAQNTMDVDDGGRTVKEVSEILKTMALEPATVEEYKRYLISLRNQEVPIE